MDWFMEVWEYVFMVVSVIIGYFIYSITGNEGVSDGVSDVLDELDAKDESLQEEQENIQERQNQDEELLNQLKEDERQIRDELRSDSDSDQKNSEIRDWVNENYTE